MNLEPEKSSELRNVSGVARVLASIVILAMAVLVCLVVLEVIPREAFSAMASKAAMLIGVAVVATAAIALLSRR
jgi:membrane protein YdbS with pleckstrin-like domain